MELHSPAGSLIIRSANFTAGPKFLDDGTAVHSLNTLLKRLSTIVLNVCRRPGDADSEPTFDVFTIPATDQQRAYDLLEVISV